MSFKLWTAAARCAGLLISSRTVMKASRAILGSLTREYRDVQDEKVKGRLVELDLRVKRAEDQVEELRRTVRKLSSAVYGLAALAIAALALALVRLV